MASLLVKMVLPRLVRWIPSLSLQSLKKGPKGHKIQIPIVIASWATNCWATGYFHSPSSSCFSLERPMRKLPGPPYPWPLPVDACNHTWYAPSLLWQYWCPREELQRSNNLRVGQTLSVSPQHPRSNPQQAVNLQTQQVRLADVGPNPHSMEPPTIISYHFLLVLLHGSGLTSSWTEFLDPHLLWGYCICLLEICRWRRSLLSVFRSHRLPAFAIS